MSDSLRDAQLRQEFRAEIMRGYQAALCNSDVPGWTLGDEVAKVADNLLAAHQPEVVVDHRPGETCSVAVDVDPETGFARQPVASRERVAEVLRTHTIECTGVGEVTCRGCRDLSWMSWDEYRIHVADAMLALIGGDAK